MNPSIIGNVINAPIWGGTKPAFLTKWCEIKKLGFKKNDRAFGHLEDGTPALFLWLTDSLCLTTSSKIVSTNGM